MSAQAQDAATGGAQHRLRLAHGLDFEDLYRREGLERLDRAFLALASALDFALAPDLDIVLAGDPSADEDCRGMLREIADRATR